MLYKIISGSFCFALLIVSQFWTLHGRAANMGLIPVKNWNDIIP